MIVKIKRLHPDSVIPKYSKIGDAGLDLTAVAMTISDGGMQVTYDIGLSFEIPQGYVGLIFPRSSIKDKDLMLSNSVGVIDSGYRGEVKAVFNCTYEDEVMYQVGDRICQMIIIPYPTIEFEEVDELSITERNTGGFGSTN